MAKRIKFPDACQVMQAYFSPLKLEVLMTAPAVMSITLSDESSGESLTMVGIACSIAMAHEEVFKLIELIEAEARALMPNVRLVSGSWIKP